MGKVNARGVGEIMDRIGVSVVDGVTSVDTSSAFVVVEFFVR